MELFKIMGTIAINADTALSDIEKVAAKAGTTHTALATLGKTTKDAGAKITAAGRAMLPATLAIGGIGVGAVKTAADFEASMSQVAATMGMTADEINNGSESYKKLERAARDMGSKTKFSAGEAAEALNYLALAGYDVDKSIDTLPKVLNLAAAGGIDLASASDMVTDAMSALGKTAGTTESFVDKMAKTSQKSNTSVAQLGEAILTVGGTAKSMAGGTTELNTALGILADNGIKGAEGGTALRNIILSLSAPTDKAAKLMADLGVSAFDADGNMRPLNETFKDLDAAMSGMTDAQKTNVLNEIFNKVDLKSANALLANCGDRFDELSGYIDNADGSAQAMADTMMNNLNGQLTTLKSALSEAGISIGQALLPAVKSVTGAIQSLTDKFNSLTPAQQQTIIKIAGLVAAIAPVLMIIGTLVSGIGSIITVIGTMSAVMSAGGGIVAALGAAFGAANIMALAIVGGIAAAIAIGVALYRNWDTIKAKASEVFGYVRDFIGNAIDGIKEFFTGLWTHIQGVWDTITNVVQVAVMLIASIISAYISIITAPWRFLWENFGGVLIAAWNGIKSAVTAALNAIKAVITTVWNAIKGVITPIVNGIKTAISTAWNAIKSVTTSVFNGIKSTVSSIWNGIKSTISSVISGIKSTISTGFSAAATAAGTAFNAVKTKISSILTSLKTLVSSAISAIKSKFNVTLPTPKLKLPHPSISGKFSLNPPSVPHFSIKWYKDAMDDPFLFTKPTVFGMNGGMKGAGEAGDEVMYGRQNLLNDISEASGARVLEEKLNKIISLLIKFFPEALDAMNQQMILDGGVLVAETAPMMNRELGRIAIQKGRGR